LLAYSNQLAETGNKVRKIGHSLGEQIKEYVNGTISEASIEGDRRKGGQLMVNKHTDEKANRSIVGRQRQGDENAFDGLTLLDYAINATLILPRVALVKQTRPGS
jgi:hypothetical protein